MRQPSLGVPMRDQGDADLSKKAVVIKPYCCSNLLILFGWLVHCPATRAQQADGMQVLVQADFDASIDSGLSGRLLEHEHVMLAPKLGPDGSNAIRVDYVGYSRGSERVVMRYPLARSVDQVTLSFDVHFDTDFQWVRGGKLHGVGPKQPVTGGNPRRPASWSARIMFRPEGRCATYLYDQHPNKTYGIGDMTDMPVFEAGRWQHVELQVRLNSPGRDDGFAAIRIDGRDVSRSDNVQFRQVGGEETQIQQLLFSTFHGGHTPPWAPVDGQGNFTTVSALFDNLRVVEGIQR